MSRIKRMSPALIIAILALIAALVVPAVAQVATKALTKREVVVVRKVSAFQADRAITRRAPRIAQFQANRQITNRAPGLDVDKVDGQDASGFAPAAEVHSPGRFVVNDPSPGDIIPQNSNLVVIGPFTVLVNCWDNYNNSGFDRATLRVTGGPLGTTFAGIRTDGSTTNTASSGSNIAIASVDEDPSEEEIQGAHYIATTPSGQVVSISGSAEVGRAAGDCLLSVTAIGP